MSSPVVYFEIMAPVELDPYLKFYADLFGWEPNQGQGDIPYRIFDTRTSQGINGGIGRHPDGENYVTFYVQVADLQARLDKAESLGGRTKMPVTEVISGELSVALIESPGGNVVGIATGTGSAPEQKDSGGRHPVVHFEVAAADASAEQKFWGDLFGWKMQTDPQFNYAMVRAEPGGIAGGVGPHPGGERHVTVYVQCDDPESVLSRAEQIGGQTLMPVMEVPGGPTIAHLGDPAGNMIGLVKG